MGSQAYHIPKGDPCAYVTSDGSPCGLKPSNHRVDHYANGDPCTHCGLNSGAHVRKRETRPHKFNSDRKYYVGIDGEGQGQRNRGRDSEHRYVLLSWSDEVGKRRDFIEAADGAYLTSEQCLDFILRLPLQARAFAFAFNYDLTKILTDVDNEVLWLLFRSERRQRRKGFEKHGPKPVHWRNYLFNVQGSKFSITDKRLDRRRVIWDTFKFYQSKFTTALEDWYKCNKIEHKKVPDPDCENCATWPMVKPAIEQMALMKAERHRFDQLPAEQVREYCFAECTFMAGLTRKLVEAGVKARLQFKSFHGAGSVAGAVLKSMQIDKTSKGANYRGKLLKPDDWRMKRNGPPFMRDAVSRAFFGGRFEHDVIGAVAGPLFGKDISSAYPYQLCFLPCLECGKWEKTADRKEIDSARTALVHYGLDASRAPSNAVWGPFPFRTKAGSIAFPITSGGGWVWRDEYLAGERLFPHVEFREAWVYRCECDHQPFREIPLLYVERLRIGKEGPGIVIKLGCNACYGKLAQSLGSNPPFQSWIWAGMITSGTRAQLLELLGLHQDWRNALGMATDGLYSRENVNAPIPRPTMTDSLWQEYETRLLADLGPERAPTEYARARALFADKPLGGWETKVVERGIFFARPGIYFPLNPTDDDLKAIRARGVGRAAMYASWRKCISAYESGRQLHKPECVAAYWQGWQPWIGELCDCPRGVSISHVDRFHGAKSSISRREMSEEEKASAVASGNYGINPLTGKRRKNLHPYVYTRGPFMADDDRTPLLDADGNARQRYGQWSRRHVDMSFDPLPKRQRINRDSTLEARRFPQDFVKGEQTDDFESAPYDKSLWSEDKARLFQAMQELLEQPDGGDYTHYERGMEG